MRDVRNAAGQRRETPYGVLYSPKTFGLQVLVLVGAFAGGPVIGWLTARTGRSVFDRGGDSLCPADVDLLFRIRPLVRQARVYRIPRYWQARIVGSFRRCLREKKPSKLSDILPTVEKLEEMAVRAQKAASSFRIVALPHYEAVQSYLRGVAHCTYGGQQSRFERITTPDETVGISPAWRRQGTGDLSGLS